jgi:hypothetical protein
MEALSLIAGFSFQIPEVIKQESRRLRLFFIAASLGDPELGRNILDRHSGQA